MERIAIVGTSGSGKTTLAQALGQRLDLPHLELDAVFHQPGWTTLATDEFQARVTEFCAADRWVTCGKYAAVRPILFGRADTIVCLDHGRLRQTLRVLRRTVRRLVTREELWNGNREPWRALWWPDREGCIVRWTWDNVPRARALFDELERHPPHPEVQIIRLHGFAEVRGFLAATAPR